ncbi:hypothetical protein DFH07DRAFT_912945 [Mycena maculata]|uniref:F-box domain-containing protein n=1 Tax=Mycena maculata TaxID=230809 RepID=A0AAD7NSW8_9AGAR|nr:hypothetical protein DFH07DRAFT_912945 [Mycena maculata]
MVDRCPGSQTLEYLPSTISTVADELARYDEEISRLWAKRVTLQAHYDEFHAFQAPIQRLPSEIPVKISASCALMPLRYADPHYYHMTCLTSVHLLTVSQVCSRWHDVALGTSVLWDTFTLHFNLRRGGRAAKSVLLAVALERGGASLLKFETYGNSSEAALRLLAVHSERWKCAEFFNCKRISFSQREGKTSLPGGSHASGRAKGVWQDRPSINSTLSPSPACTQQRPHGMGLGVMFVTPASFGV